MTPYKPANTFEAAPNNTMFVYRHNTILGTCRLETTLGLGRGNKKNRRLNEREAVYFL